MRALRRASLVQLVLLGLGLVVFWFFLHEIDFATIELGLSQLSLVHILLVLFLSMLTILIRAVRWQYLIEKVSGTKVGAVFSFLSILAGIAAGSITPSRAGEVAKPFMLKEHYGVRVSKTLGAVVVERGFDLLSLLLFLFLSFGFVGATHNFEQFSWVFVGLFLLLVFVLFVFPKPLERFCAWGIVRFCPIRFKERLANLNSEIFSSFGVLRDLRVFGFVAGSSLLGMVVEFARLYVVFHALNLDISWWVVVFALSGSVVVGLLTMIPGGIGTTEISMVAILVLLVGGIQTEFFSLGVLIDRFFSYYLLIALGAAILVVWRKRNGKEA